MDHIINRSGETSISGLTTFIALWMTAATVADAPIVVQPKTYLSPSKAYSLAVKPHDRKGEGKATYELLQGQKQVWAGDRNYTLVDVNVTDAGSVVGVAYRSEKGGDGEMETDYLHLIILNPDGSELLNDARVQHYVQHASPQPYVAQLVVDQGNDRALFRVVGEEDERGWGSKSSLEVFKITNGKPTGTWQLDESIFGGRSGVRVMDMRAIPNSTCLLVHAHMFERTDEKPHDSAYVAILDERFQNMWEYTVANDYDAIDRRRSRGLRMDDFFSKQPAILSLENDGRFDVRSFSNSSRLKFQLVKSDKNGWTVKELGSEPFTPPEEKIGPTKGTLRYLGTLDLGTEVEDSGSFFDFTFDGEGSIYALRAQGDERVLVHMNVEGNVFSERPFRPTGRFDWTDLARMKDDQFFMVSSKEKGSDEPITAWLANCKTGESVKLPLDIEFEGWIHGATRLSDGGLVVSEGLTRRSTGVDRLMCFNPDGSRRWFIDSGGNTRHEILGLGPADITQLTDGRLALLCHSEVRILDKYGGLVSVVDLNGAFGSTEFRGSPGYLSEIVADKDGGFALRNYRTPPVVVRFKRDGTIRSRWSPHQPDGDTFDIPLDVRVAPDGRFWTGTDRAILRLTDEGVVDKIIGQPVELDELENIAGFTVGWDGKLYAVASETGAVHVFDSAGRRLKILNPEPTDIPGSMEVGFVAVKDNGEVFLQRPSTQVYMPPVEYLKFNAAGTREAIVTFKTRLGTDQFGPGWKFQPTSGYRCGINSYASDESLVMIDSSDETVQTIPKRPNGNWFAFVVRFDIAPDGKMAVLSREFDADDHAGELDIFAANGDPIRSIVLPPAKNRYVSMAYDGHRGFVVSDDELLIVDSESASSQRFSLEPTGDEPRGWNAFLNHNSSELLLFSSARYSPSKAKIYRYKLPAMGGSSATED